jgi:hypothetical protein
MPSKVTDPRLAAAQRLLPHHIHLTPDLWRAVPNHPAEHFSDPFAPARLVAARCACLPAALLDWWVSLPSGHILITAQTNSYTIGQLVDEPRQLRHVVCISLHAIIGPSLFHWLAMLLDHHLGTDGAAVGPWLSDGGGFNARWLEVGQRVHQLASLGYGFSAESQADAHVYFAEGVATYLDNRRVLNVQDPKLERLLHTTLMDEDFCRRALR